MAQYPVITAGERITADLLTSMISDYTVKQSSETRVSTTTLAADSELTGVSLSVGRWEVVVTGCMQGGTSGIAIKTQWAFSGTWNNPIRFCDGPTSSNTVAGGSAFSRQWTGYLTNANCIYGLATGAAYTGFREESGLIQVTVAGLMSLNWAQNVSNANGSTITQGTKIIARKIGD